MLLYMVRHHGKISTVHFFDCASRQMESLPGQLLDASVSEQLERVCRGFGKPCGAVVVGRRRTGLLFVLREVGLSGAAKIKMWLPRDC